MISSERAVCRRLIVPTTCPTPPRLASRHFCNTPSWSPLPACEERPRASCARVRGAIREFNCGKPPHPDPLPASGAREITHPCIPAARYARGLQENPCPRNQRAQGMPDARCIRGLACKLRKKRTRAYRAAEAIRHSPRSGLRLTPSSPWRPGLFATIAPKKLSLLKNLTPASGRQDHTASPSAPVFRKSSSAVLVPIRRSFSENGSALFVVQRRRVHRIPPPTSVTIAKRPSEQGRDGRYIN